MSETSNPFFSIIIATKNISDEFHNTLQSLFSQDFNSYEVIIIDSSDKKYSKNIINQYSDKVDHILNKGDNGIYDAWNQGLSVSRGKWIMFLGSGDTLVNNILKKVHEKISHKNLDLFLTNINFVSKTSSKLIKPKSLNLINLSKYIQPPHPGIFHNKDVFINYGNFDDNYKIAGDYEFLLRLVENINYEILDIISVKMLAGGISQSLSVTKEAFKIQYLDKRIRFYSVIYNYLRLSLKIWLKK